MSGSLSLTTCRAPSSSMTATLARPVWGVDDFSYALDAASGILRIVARCVMRGEPFLSNRSTFRSCTQDQTGSLLHGSARIDGLRFSLTRVRDGRHARRYGPRLVCFSKGGE
jgi:hypothetical protein